MRPQMATYTFSFFFFFFFFSALLLQSCYAESTSKPQAFIFPIKKDANTSQYYTTIHIGSNSTTLNVVIDLGGKFLWFNSADYFSAASSYRPLLCGTHQCSIANAAACTPCTSNNPAPICTDNTCSDAAHNPFSGWRGYSGLGLDVLRVYSTRAFRYKVNNFPFQFADPLILEGLATPIAGLIGLGRSRISLQAHLASAFKIPQKFVLCIPSSGNEGNLIIGQTPYKKPFPKISKSLFTTALIRNPVSTSQNEVIGNLTAEYFINVKSIRVGGRALTFNTTLLSINTKTGDGGTSIRTVRAYTNLHKSIYTPLINEFAKAAAKKGVKRVASEAPFGACFDSKTIKASKTGLDVPIIDLVLENKSVYWRFYGANSMVGVGNGVVCLAFVEGKPNLTGPTTSIEVGGYQMENYLVEFDVASTRLGFSSSLLLHDTNCSHFII